MDAYSGYNHIQMDPMDTTKTFFMSNHDNYYYNVMPFKLKNIGATYQRPNYAEPKDLCWKYYIKYYLGV